jgi:hypothetical protein
MSPKRKAAVVGGGGTLAYYVLLLLIGWGADRFPVECSIHDDDRRGLAIASKHDSGFHLELTPGRSRCPRF